MAFTTTDRTNHATLVDDDGSGTVGTIWSKAKIGNVPYDDIDATLAKLARCQVYNNATQSISSGAFAALTFNSEDIDDGGLHSTVSNTSRITIPTGMGGIYLIGGATFFAANATGIRQIQVLKNGVTIVGTRGLTAGFSVGGVGPALHTQALVSLAAADYVELSVFQDSGGALNVGNAARELASQAWAIRIL